MLGNTRHLVARLATRQNSNTRVLAMAQTKMVAVAGNGVDARKISNNVQFGTQVFIAAMLITIFLKIIFVRNY